MTGDKVIQAHFKYEIETIVGKYLLMTLTSDLTAIDIVEALQEVVDDRVKNLKAALDAIEQEKK